MLKAESKKSFCLAASIALVLAVSAYAAVTAVPDAVKNALKRCESHNRYDIMGGYNNAYAGAYQFSNDHFNTCINTGVCGKYGVTNKSEFLQSREAQDAYFEYYAVNMANSILADAELSQYIGQKLPGTDIEMTLWGLFMGAHLLGKWGLTKSMRSVMSGGKSAVDGFGTSGNLYIALGSSVDLNTTGPDPTVGSCGDMSVAGFIGGSGGNFGEGSVTGDGGAGSTTGTNRFQVENLPWYTGGDDTLSDERYKELFEDSEECKK